MNEYKVLLKQFPYVKLYSVVHSQGSRGKTTVAQKLPKDAKYHVDITLFPTHISRNRLETKYRKSMFVCLLTSTYDSYGERVGFRGGSSSSSDFPSLLDCERCEWACKRGRLTSVTPYGLFVDYKCKSCGFEYEGSFYLLHSPCKKCGQPTVEVVPLGNPHINKRYWVFQLHLQGYKVRETLGELLGVTVDNQLHFSCKGSWHNFDNNSSGFDICHVNCLNDLIETRIKKNLRGLELFMNNYPEEGKVLTGNNVDKQCWINGKTLPCEEYRKLGKGKEGVKKV